MPGPATLHRRWPAAGFLRGFNLPWQIYGCDFGANVWLPDGGISAADRRDALRLTLASLAAREIEAVRWFLLCDGRAGLVRDGAGHGVGLQPQFWRDLETGLALVEEAGLRAMLVLLDFQWFFKARVFRGALLGGGLGTVTARGPRERFLEGVVRPILACHGRDPRVLAWDLVNEPEWATFGHGGRNPLRTLRPRSMRAWLSAMAAVARSEASQPLTVGLASPSGLRLTRGVVLDVEQWHWYPSWRRRRMPSVTDASPGRPVVLGEYSTAVSAAAAEGADLARRKGYCAAFAWSALARDRHTDARLLPRP